MEGGRKLTDDEKAAVLAGTYKPSEQTVEQKEVAPEEKAEEQTEAKVDEKPFDYSVFKKFGKDIESEDALKELFEKADKYDVTSKSYDEANTKLEEYKRLAEKANPLSNFLNEDEFKRQQLLIAKKDELTEGAIKALSVLTPSKVKDLSDADALKMQLMIDKGLTDKEAEVYLLRKYDIDEFGDDIDAGVKTVIKVDAIDARKNVAKLYDGITIPSSVDYETARTQLKEAWNTAVPEIIRGIDKIKIAEGVDFVVTDEMKRGLQESTLSWLVSEQIKPSEDAGAKVVGKLKDQILLSNIGSVVKSIEADLREKLKAENRASVHNDKPLNDGGGKTSQQLDNDSKMSKMLR